MSARALSPVSGPVPGSLRCFTRLLMVATLAACLFTPIDSRADEIDDAERAVVKMATRLEKDGFEFRADIWSRPLAPDLGKAVRVQFFKGNEYRVCVAVPPQSGVQISAHVLGPEMDGKPLESKVEKTEDGSGVIMHVQPKRTGVYVVVVARSGGKEKATACAMINGYK